MQRYVHFLQSLSPEQPAFLTKKEIVIFPDYKSFGDKICKVLKTMKKLPASFVQNIFLKMVGLFR